MFSIKTKYIILIWIIILILFTFYCIVRLGYIHEKYYTIVTQSTKPNIISYINNIQSKNQITDISGCSDMYDDNITVQSLGYNNCQNAYSDYLAKNLDTTDTYGLPKALIEICPVSSKSEKYSQCLQSLMSTFTDNANILDIITSDINTSINKRVVDRNTAISGIETAINPFVYSSSQVDFNNNMKMNGQVAKYQEDTLGLVNSYYKDRYKNRSEGFGNVTSVTPLATQLPLPTPTNLSHLSTLVLDSKLINNFFGIYKPIDGQFTSLQNLNITIGYDKTNQSNNVSSITVNNLIEVIPPKIVLTIDNGNLIIQYIVNNLEYYKASPYAIKLNLNEKKIIADTDNSQQNQSIIIQQLLSTLGINVPSRLIMTYEDSASTENIINRTYKLVNDNLDTILVLERL